MSFGLKSVPFGPKWLDSVISLVLVMVQFQKNWLLKEFLGPIENRSATRVKQLKSHLNGYFIVAMLDFIFFRALNDLFEETCFLIFL